MCFVLPDAPIRLKVWCRPAVRLARLRSKEQFILMSRGFSPRWRRLPDWASRGRCGEGGEL